VRRCAVSDCEEPRGNAAILRDNRLPTEYVNTFADPFCADSAVQNGYPSSCRETCQDLGLTVRDPAGTVEKAYDYQIACDARNTPKYLAALERISEQSVAGKESLQIKVVMERSMNKYTTGEIRSKASKADKADDVTTAYDAIGYTSAYAEAISVPPEDAPDSHIYDMHKKATLAAASHAERTGLGAALATIGRHRDVYEMRRMGEAGQTLMSVDEAYCSLNAPKEALDEGLIM
jgi:ubiquitin carboxyl-terminal hydrolase 25/28